MTKARTSSEPEDGPVLLVEFLKQKALSYRDFGNKVGCTKAHVCGLVNGKTLPSLDLAVKIEEVTKGRVGANSWTSTQPAPARRSRA